MISVHIKSSAAELSTIPLEQQSIVSLSLYYSPHAGALVSLSQCDASEYHFCVVCKSWFIIGRTDNAGN